MSKIIPFKKPDKEREERIKESLDRINTLLDELKEVAKKNEANEERLKRERSEANKKVLKDYRIKD